VRCVSEEAGILCGLMGIVDDVDSAGDPMVKFDGDDIALMYHRSYFRAVPEEAVQAAGADTPGPADEHAPRGPGARCDVSDCEGAPAAQGEGPGAAPRRYFKTLQKIQLWRSKEKNQLLGHLPAATLVEVLEACQDGWLRVLVEHGLAGWFKFAGQTEVRCLQALPPSLAMEEEMEHARLVQAKGNTTDAVFSETSGSTRNNSAGSCDKCDGPHATASCPFYKCGREEHRDAWANYGHQNPLKLGSDAGKFVLRNARVVRQPGDGSCLFHSMAAGLREACSDESAASDLREDILTFLEGSPGEVIAGDTLEEWVQWDAGSTVDAYVRRMRGQGSWGGGIEMACCSLLKRVSVHVYEACAGGFRRISRFESARPRATIHVLYQGRMHYDALSLQR